MSNTPLNTSAPATFTAPATTAQSVESEISAAVSTAANIAEVIAPQYAGFIVLGQAVASAAPTLIADVMALIEQDEPSAADTTALAQKIVALLNPATL